MTKGIHATAIVDKNARLGKGVSIGAYSIVGPKVTLGDGCSIGSHVVIEGNTTIGKNNKFFQFSSVGSIPQHLKFHGEDSRLIMGDNNVVRECVTLNIGTENGGMVTQVGSDNLFMAYTHIAHDCKVGNYNIFANSATLAGHVEITNHVILGGLCAVHQFVRIGEYAILAGGSMVGKDVPNYCIAQGDHASLKGINVIALRRNGFPEEDITLIRRVYRALFWKPGNLEKKIAELSDDVKANVRIAAWLEFIRSSERGLASGSQGEE